MTMVTNIAGFALLAAALGVHAARADVVNEKPWDWAQEERLLVPGDSGSICEALREYHKSSQLNCVVDHKSWDAHLAHELKKPKQRDRDSRTPNGTCGNLAFSFFRDTNENGLWPGNGSNPPDTAKLDEEFRAKVKTIECRWDDKARAPHVAYDPSAHKVTFFMTAGDYLSMDWAAAEFKRMTKEFPELNKWWGKHH
jgi:hypothetical protein